jgi:uncharacterized protein (TIGR02466 family)
LSRFDEAAYLLDKENLIQSIMLSPPNGFGSISEFNRALCDHIRRHPTLRSEATNRSLKHGLATSELLDDNRGPFASLKYMIKGAVEQYRDNLSVGPQHPFRQGMPDRLSLEVWANTMDADGLHATHFHPPGWLSGTYYRALPPDADLRDRDDARRIEFGRSIYSIPTKIEPPTHTVRTREGMVVLFPSYFGHRTAPFKSKEKRVNIAFDAIARI